MAKKNKNSLCPKTQAVLDEIGIDANRMTKFKELWDMPVCEFYEPMGSGKQKILKAKGAFVKVDSK